MGAFSKTFSLGGLGSQGSLLKQILNLFGFFSKENESDYYASLEDGSPYLSLTEKE